MMYLYFMCVGILPTCMCTMCLQYLKGPEEGIRSHETVDIDSGKPHVGAGT